MHSKLRQEKGGKPLKISNQSKKCNPETKPVKIYCKPIIPCVFPLYLEDSFPLSFAIYQGIEVPGIGTDGAIQAYDIVPNSIVTVRVKAVRKGNEVLLQIPAFSLTLPEGQNFVQSISQIPIEFRPTTAIDITGAAGSNNTDNFPFDIAPATGFYQVQITRTGIIKFGLPGFYAIPGGQFIVNTTSISFIISKLTTFDNFLISSWGPSNVQDPKADSATIFDQFLEFDGIDIANGRIMTSWGDNAKTPAILANGQPGKLLNLAFSRIDVDKQLQQVIGPEYLLPIDEFQAESSLAINQLNPDWVAIVSASIPRPLGDDVNTGNLYAISYDGGKTFSVSILGRPPGPFPYPPMLGADAQLGWDRFGNLWMAYLSGDPVNFDPTTLVIIGSPKGDPNKFRLITVVSTPFPGTEEFGVDYAWLRVGPDSLPDAAIDGKRAEAVWTFTTPVNNDANFLPNGNPLIITAFRVRGALPDDINAPLTGIVDPVQQFLPEATDVGGFGDIVVESTGGVIVIGQSTQDNALFSSSNSYSVIYDVYNPLGLVGQFSTRRNIAFTTLGWAEFIQPQANRGIDINPHAAIDRSYARKPDRIYLTWVDKKVPTPGQGLGSAVGEVGIETSPPSNQQVILLSWSDNHGLTWADPVQVNNDLNSRNSHFNPSIAVDQTTGDIVIAWKDTRGDESNILCNWIGARITFKEIEELECERNRKVEVHFP